MLKLKNFAFKLNPIYTRVVMELQAPKAANNYLYKPFHTSAHANRNLNIENSTKNKDSLKKVKGGLPNSWVLAEEFIKLNPYLKFCTDHLCFYYYTKDDLYWKQINKSDVNYIFIKWLQKTYPSEYRNFQPRRLEDLILIFQTETRISIFKEKGIINSKGFLIPFLNGVLNSKNLSFIPHHPDLYCTHVINANYDLNKGVLNTPFETFLTEFVNFKPLLLNTLRSFLYLIFTNETKFQIALYIYGPGGTGKSTLINMLLFLLSPETSYSTTISQLTSRFGLSRIANKTFIVLNDMTHFKGKEPGILKELIAGDIVESEKKYRKTISINPKVILTITSNSIWELVNPTGGINRRIVYFPADYVPQIKDLNLFNIGQDNLAEGTLAPYLPGFLNWILSCPLDYVDSLKAGGEKITKFINPDNFINNHHLNDWVSQTLVEESESKIQVGNNKSNNSTLYVRYLDWCNINNIVPSIKINRFSELLSDNFKSLGWNVTKRRTSTGFFFIGIKYMENNSSSLKDLNSRNTQLKLGKPTDSLNYSILFHQTTNINEETEIATNINEETDIAEGLNTLYGSTKYN